MLYIRSEKSGCKFLSIRFILLFLICSTFISTGQAAVSTTTAKTIQGSSPRFIAEIENGIEAGQDFEYFGVKYNGTDYFSEKELALAFEQNNINIGALTPLGLKLTPALGTPIESAIIDADGDKPAPLEAQSAKPVTLEWYYENAAGNQVALTTAQKGYTFTRLKTSGIYPYAKIQGNIVLKTQYGDPRSQDYPDTKIAINTQPVREFYIPLGTSSVLYASPNMTYASGIYVYANNTDVFNPGNGFVPQPENQKNFPTTGANGLYFYLVTEGVPNTLSTTKWEVKTSDTSATPITAVVDKMSALGITGFKNYDPANMVLVTLQGPDASIKNQTQATAEKANVPVEIEITATDKMGGDISYKFIITKWFVNRSNVSLSLSVQQKWCQQLDNLGSYDLVSATDVSNAQSSKNSSNWYRRMVGEGLITEWGVMANYRGAYFYNVTYGWTRTLGTSNRGNNFYVNMNDAALNDDQQDSTARYAMCVSQ